MVTLSSRDHQESRGVSLDQFSATSSLQCCNPNICLDGGMSRVTFRVLSCVSDLIAIGGALMTLQLSSVCHCDDKKRTALPSSLRYAQILLEERIGHREHRKKFKVNVIQNTFTMSCFVVPFLRDTSDSPSSKFDHATKEALPQH